jgi:phospholipid/cholesterol/gamma-HCH transport system substrate-binding protein
LKIPNEIKVGAVIIVSLGLLYFGINYLKGSDIFSNSREFYAVYEKIDGLNLDNVVIVNGFKVGRVSSISLMPERGNKILVRMEILEEQLVIPDGSVARIISQDLLGSKAIALEFSDATEPHQAGDTLVSGMEEAIQRVIEEKLAPLQAKLERVIDESRDMITTTQVLIENTNTQVKAAGAGLESITQTSKSINNMVVRQDSNISIVLSDIHAIALNIRNNSKQINDIIENVATISDSLTRANYASAVANASSALEQLDSLMTMINSGQGSLGMLLNDDKLYKNLEQASLEIDKLAEDLRVNPDRYVHISVFGKKQKGEVKPNKKGRDANGQVINPDGPN